MISPRVKDLEAEVARLKAECRQLRHDFCADVPVTTPDSTEPVAVPFKGTDSDQIRIYIVWALGTYPNGVRLLDIQAITTSLGRAKLYSKMMRRDRQPYEMWERIVIEPRVANHLYGEKMREYLVATGKM